MDLLFAGVETLLTFNVAYPTAVTLAKVLLQTAPDKGTADGRMDSFVRVVREVRFVNLHAAMITQLNYIFPARTPLPGCACPSTAHLAALTPEQDSIT